MLRVENADSRWKAVIVMESDDDDGLLMAVKMMISVETMIVKANDNISGKVFINEDTDKTGQPLMVDCEEWWANYKNFIYIIRYCYSLINNPKN